MAGLRASSRCRFGRRRGRKDMRRAQVIVGGGGSFCSALASFRELWRAASVRVHAWITVDEVATRFIEPIVINCCYREKPWNDSSQQSSRSAESGTSPPSRKFPV